MTRPTLALVVIGRNPGTDLVRLLDTALAHGFSEVIFADSGSTDGSSAVAAARGVKVVVVPPGEPGAAAARAAGTAIAKSEWILHLDSDMVPDLKVVDRIHDLLSGLSSEVAGVTALTRDRFPDGKSYVRHAHERSGDRASYFGGAVVLRRSAVMDAGDWNPLVIANEELDLHARLRAKGYHLVFEDAVLVDHHTSLQRVSDKLAVLLNWRGRAGYRYGAPGLALRSCLARGAALHLLALSPEPFLVAPASVAFGVVALAGWPWVGLTMLATLWVWVGRRRGLPYLVPSYLLFPQVFVGMLRYGPRAG